MAAKTLYFRNLQGGAPAGSWELREVFPTGAEDSTTDHDSCGNCASPNMKSINLKPGVARTKAEFNAKPNGLPETSAPPSAANQFGWFSENSYNGTFAAAAWTFQFRHDDNRAQVAGHFVANVYKCTSKDFAGTFTFLFQTGETTEWWTNNTSTQSRTDTPAAITLTDEFLFVQIWCHEHNSDGTARNHGFHVEGSGLTEATVSKIVTSDFTLSQVDNVGTDTATITEVGVGEASGSPTDSVTVTDTAVQQEALGLNATESLAITEDAPFPFVEGVDSETVTASESATGTADATATDNITASESGLGAADATATDSWVLTESGVGAADATAVDAWTLTDDGVQAVVGGAQDNVATEDVTVSDTAVQTDTTPVAEQVVTLGHLWFNVPFKRKRDAEAEALAKAEQQRQEDDAAAIRALLEGL